MRLSPPGQESTPHILKDGDIIQLGVDYQGGTEEMYRCVKIKVEVGQGREWQGGANAFKFVPLVICDCGRHGELTGPRAWVVVPPL